MDILLYLKSEKTELIKNVKYLIDLFHHKIRFFELDETKIQDFKKVVEDFANAKKRCWCFWLIQSFDDPFRILDILDGFVKELESDPLSHGYIVENLNLWLLTVHYRKADEEYLTDPSEADWPDYPYTLQPLIFYPFLKGQIAFSNHDSVEYLHTSEIHSTILSLLRILLNSNEETREQFLPTYPVPQPSLEGRVYTFRLLWYGFPDKWLKKKLGLLILQNYKAFESTRIEKDTAEEKVSKILNDLKEHIEIFSVQNIFKNVQLPLYGSQIDKLIEVGNNHTHIRDSLINSLHTSVNRVLQETQEKIEDVLTTFLDEKLAKLLEDNTFDSLLTITDVFEKKHKKPVERIDYIADYFYNNLKGAIDDNLSLYLKKSRVVPFIFNRKKKVQEFLLNFENQILPETWEKFRQRIQNWMFIAVTQKFIAVLDQLKMAVLGIKEQIEKEMQSLEKVLSIKYVHGMYIPSWIDSMDIPQEALKKLQTTTRKWIQNIFYAEANTSSFKFEEVIENDIIEWSNKIWNAKFNTIQQEISNISKKTGVFNDSKLMKFVGWEKIAWQPIWAQHMTQLPQKFTPNMRTIPLSENMEIVIGSYAELKNNWIVQYFRWTYKSERYRLRWFIHRKIYEKSLRQSREKDITKWAKTYVLQGVNEYVKNLSYLLKGLSPTPSDHVSLAEFVIEFVRNFVQYKREEGEYPKYPLETLIERSGDCEDFSITGAALLYVLGYEVALLHLPGHMALGIAGPGDFSGFSIEYNGKQYYYCEMTAPNTPIGDIPPAQILDVFPIE